MEAAGHFTEEKDKLKNSLTGKKHKCKKNFTSDSTSQIILDNVSDGSDDSNEERLEKKKIEMLLNKTQITTEKIDDKYTNVAGTRVNRKKAPSNDIAKNFKYPQINSDFVEIAEDFL